MTYAPRDYLHLFVGGLIVFVAAVWLSPLDLDSDTELMLVLVCFGILVAGWLIRRNKS
jgi:hypothetical protein